jgi:chemotaxis protein methyltransferase CheR
MMNPLQEIEDALTLAQAIVNTIHEPFVVLDTEFRVLAASRSFYETFKVDPEHTQGCLLYALGALSKQMSRDGLRPEIPPIASENHE